MSMTKTIFFDRGGIDLILSFFILLDQLSKTRTTFNICIMIISILYQCIVIYSHYVLYKDIFGIIIHITILYLFGYIDIMSV